MFSFQSGYSHTPLLLLIARYLVRHQQTECCLCVCSLLHPSAPQPHPPWTSHHSIETVFTKVINVLCVAQTSECSLDLILHSCGQHGWLHPSSQALSSAGSPSFCRLLLCVFWRPSLLGLVLRMQVQGLPSSCPFLLSFTPYLQMTPKVYSQAWVPLQVQIHGSNCLTEYLTGLKATSYLASPNLNCFSPFQWIAPWFILILRPRVWGSASTVSFSLIRYLVHHQVLWGFTSQIAIESIFSPSPPQYPWIGGHFPPGRLWHPLNWSPCFHVSPFSTLLLDSLSTMQIQCVTFLLQTLLWLPIALKIRVMTLIQDPADHSAPMLLALSFQPQWPSPSPFFSYTPSTTETLYIQVPLPDVLFLPLMNSHLPFWSQGGFLSPSYLGQIPLETLS